MTIAPVQFEKPPRHYPTPSAKCADLCVHVIGLTAALIGGAVLIGLSVWRGSPLLTTAVGIYSAGLLLMLACSTAYNFAPARHRPLLRRLDHAGIFIMIAGSYTPFTVAGLSGAWAVAMTAAIWGVAALGVAGKLFLSGLDRKLWVIIYLALGWAVVVALQPLMAALPPSAMLLLAIGGAVYSIGVIFYMMRRLPFRRAIWHGHVIGGAGVHYAAVLVGVVLGQHAAI
ncbi:hemolysin III family protein [Phenylobacterium sp.]|jgi:hemolysin III|uniref:PAQR family membrane homeostasis protein TrhA n=1 Tax=Phenylobacterium sp. TaxID=1871053 RepID=UPI000C928972|nr:hemolysin III family protein [Phenylobacterium sp.]MAK83126.1 hemolysin III [Phenylobacterium sp.]|tara:strand:+ start:6646 stop:7329 length:684 start_codon:yes stop_codon:yes gene_type:complete